jgi:signal transduction histidine kinase
VSSIASAAGDRALRAGRGLAQGVIVALLALFAAGIVQWARHGAQMPGGWTAPEGQSPAAVRTALAEWGLPVGWWVGLFLLLEVFLVVVSAVAAYVVLRGTTSWFRLYLAVVLVLFATTGGGVPIVIAGLYPSIAEPAQMLQGVAWFALFPLAYVFPDGRFVPGWSRWLVLAWVAAFVAINFSDAVWPVLLALFGSAAFAQIYRYVKVSGPVERQQIKWVALAVALRFAFNVVLLLTPLATLQKEPGPRGLAVYAAVMVVSYVLAALLPAAVAVAVVRHRLFDVDVVISRTLAFGVLTALVIGVYAAAVAAVGALWPGDRVVGPLVAAGIVAVGFNPVRARVQRQVNRLVFGDRADPYGVLSRLGQRLAAVVEPERVAPTIAETVRAALRSPYAAVALGDPPTVVAEAGRRPSAERIAEFPVTYQGRALGHLVVSGAEAADRRLLADLAGQCGAALAAADDAARTRALAADLQHTRERLVTAREEERRRIRGDLHDSLGPALSGQALTIDAARALLTTDPGRADTLLNDLKAHSQTLLSDVRRLARDLRPPALDELGLAGAVRQIAEDHGATVEVGPLPTLPAAVEVAAYRIAHEALTNVARHADARTCSLSLTLDGDRLVLAVADDGRGLPADTRSGVGLASMRERAEELGGALSVTGDDGTRVVATLPVAVTA